jgi:hypothetical protein
MVKIVEFHGYQKKVPKQQKNKNDERKANTKEMKKGNYRVHYYIFHFVTH